MFLPGLQQYRLHPNEIVMAEGLTISSSDIPGHDSTSWHTIPVTGAASIPVVLIQFDAWSFSPAAFAEHGIELPATIAASVQKRQAEFFFGRQAARFSLLALTGNACTVGIGDNREPIWPAGVVGSITHDSRFAAAVTLDADRYSGIGIDIERIVSAEVEQSLRATVVSAQELACLGTQGARVPMATLLTLVFSAKESFFKGAYRAVGRYFDFSAAEVFSLDLQGGRIFMKLRETLSPEFVEDQAFEVRFDWIQHDTILTSFIW